MLNPFLFAALSSAFGHVQVENDGQQADIVPDTAHGTAGWRLSETGSHGEQYRVDCPFCRDHGRHLYISYLSYARPVYHGVELCTGPLRAHCFRRNCCADPSNRDRLAGMIGSGMSMVGDGMQTSASVDMSQVEDDSSSQALSSYPGLEGIRSWAPAFRWLADDPPEQIVEYAEKRRLTPELAEQFKLGWGPVSSPRTGRPVNGGVPFILIPIEMNGRLVGMQARCPDCFLTEDGVRYWFHPGTRKRTLVYNIDRARDIGLAVVCEGVFDVFSVGSPGVCCFGHTLSSAQDGILSTVSRCVILLPDTDEHADFDTVQEARTQAAEWNAAERYPLGAHVVVLPAKDAGEMRCEEVWKTIVRQVPPEVREFINDRVVGNL